MQVSSGRPHMLMSNQRGRGHEPVMVAGRTRSLVTVSMASRSFVAHLFQDLAEFLDFLAVERPVPVALRLERAGVVGSRLFRQRQ